MSGWVWHGNRVWHGYCMVTEVEFDYSHELYNYVINSSYNFVYFCIGTHRERVHVPQIRICVE